ncbi:MAG: glucans biosynthesis glucosyltransferase MdoH [Pseudomonadota bacterium]
MSAPDASLPEGDLSPIRAGGPVLRTARRRVPVPARFWVFAAITLAFSVPLVIGLAAVLAPLEAIDVLLVSLFALNTLWVSAAAATAILGTMGADQEKTAPRPASTGPRERTAVLFLICGEDPAAVVRSIEALNADLARDETAGDTDLWLLSDTGPAAAKREEQAIAPLLAAGLLRYRRRVQNLRRKPGNLADWVQEHGHAYQNMLVMDADSGMTAARLKDLRLAMEADPRLGLIQSGISLRPGGSRFTRLQRLSTRLAGPAFIRGLGAWAGQAGNYWGHNALIRVAAFRTAMDLPALRGPAPYGGDFLSHDFIEAAWLVRAGWKVEISPDMRGSFEDGSDRLETFHRRDRRWCQGNLQHIRALLTPGLHPLSRLHLAFGIQSYLSSPIWLIVILLFLLAGMAPGAVPILSGALALLLVPKITAMIGFLRRTRRRSRRRVFLRASMAELLLSTLVSPLVMVRQSLAVCAVILGRDCGWKGPRRLARPASPDGSVECAAGLALVALAALGGETAYQALWLTLICGPLIGAPWLYPWLDRDPAR